VEAGAEEADDAGDDESGEDDVEDDDEGHGGAPWSVAYFDDEERIARARKTEVRQASEVRQPEVRSS
jgi:hypothetical protein